MPGQSDISSLITHFVTEFPDRELPESAMHILHLSLVDWVSVTLAGQGEAVSRLIREIARDEGGVEESLVVGLKSRLPARAAAMVNGTISHALDYDDTHFFYLGHPSVAVIPAALAAADKLGARPEAFQEAALIGVEVACRIGVWLGRAHYRTGFHITSTAGTFGAAMAVARLMQLSPEQTANALGLAASRAAGVKIQFGTMGKPYHAGMAASAGIEVAHLAAKGLAVAKNGLEGPQGFGETHHGESCDDAFSGLGETYIFESVSHKFHTCCHGTHAALEALVLLRSKHRFKPDDVDAIDIIVHPQYLDICSIAEPVTGLEAKFSYRMVAALALHERDTAKMETFTDDMCNEPALLALRDRVCVSTVPTIEETAARVQLKLRNGTVLSAEYDLNSLTDPSEREVKIRSKAASLLGSDRAASLWKAVTNATILPSDWIKENEV